MTLAIRQSTSGRWVIFKHTKAWRVLWGTDQRAAFNYAGLRIRNAISLAVIPEGKRLNQQRMTDVWNNALVPVMELIGQTTPFDPFDSERDQP